MRSPTGQRQKTDNSMPQPTERGRAASRQNKENTAWKDEPRYNPPNVNELKTRFQTSDPSLDTIRTAEIQPTSRGRFGAVKGSPDIKRKRGNEGEAVAQQSKPQRPPAEKVAGDGAMQQVDPEEFFESTNHVQRFKYTRAIFAKMEEESRKAKEKQQHINQKRTGPPKMVSPSQTVRSPPANELSRGVPHGYRSQSESGRYGVESRTTRGRGSRSVEREIHAPSNDASRYGWEQTYRVGSVENLSSESDISPPTRSYSGSLSRSESDLTAQEKTEQELLQSIVPSAKLLKERYESAVQKKDSGSASWQRGARSASTSSDMISPGAKSPSDTINHSKLQERNKERATGSSNTATALPASTSTTTSVSRTSRLASQEPLPGDDSQEPLPDDSQEPLPGDSRNHAGYTTEHSAPPMVLNSGSDPPSGSASSGSRPQTAEARTSGYSGQNSVSSLRATRPNSLNQASSGSNRTSRYERPRSYSNDSQDTNGATDDGTGVRWRSRYSRPQNTRPASTSGGYPSTAPVGGVLLHKRRSRDGNGISKEEIEASLQEADHYWNASHGGEEQASALDSKMTDSTYSSGSGEEMARSEHAESGGHDLIESPISPTEKSTRKSWASKYAIQKASNSVPPPRHSEDSTLTDITSRFKNYGEPDVDNTSGDDNKPFSNSHSYSISSSVPDTFASVPMTTSEEVPMDTTSADNTSSEKDSTPEKNIQEEEPKMPEDNKRFSELSDEENNKFASPEGMPVLQSSLQDDEGSNRRLVFNKTSSI